MATPYPVGLLRANGAPDKKCERTPDKKNASGPRTNRKRKTLLAPTPFL